MPCQQLHFTRGDVPVHRPSTRRIPEIRPAFPYFTRQRAHSPPVDAVLLLLERTRAENSFAENPYFSGPNIIIVAAFH
jgi:hypothetical protein